MKQWHFEDKVYKRWVVLAICSWEELLKELEDSEYKFIDEMPPRAAGMNFRFNLDNSNQTCTMIWMPRFNKTVLVHELIHLVMHTFNQLQIPIGIENEETFAFLMEYWFAEIQEVYRKHPKGRTATRARGH